MDIATLGLRIDADGAIRSTERLTGNLDRLGTTGEAVASKLKTALGFLGLGLGFHELLKNTIDAQSALAQLDAAVRSTGGAAGFSVAQLEAQAAALSNLSGAANEAVQGGLARLLSYTAITGETFERASLAALDMAARLGIDVAGAAERVGNALNYPTLALNSLTKQGFRFTEVQKRLITDFENSGQIAKAQAIILGELELAYGGAAAAARNTLGGALQGLKNAMFDSLEATKQQTTELVRFINATSDAIKVARTYGAEIQAIAISLAGVAAAFAVAKVATAAWIAMPLGIWLFSIQAAFAAASVAGTGFSGVMAGLTFITAPLLAALGPVTLALAGFLAVYATYKTLVTEAAAAEAEADAQDQDRIRRTVARIQARNAAIKASADAEKAAANSRAEAWEKERTEREKAAKADAKALADFRKGQLDAQRAVEDRLAGARRALDQEQQMAVARQQGQAAVDRLTVAIAGETAANELGLPAMAAMVAEAHRLAEARARLVIETRKAAEEEEKLTKEISDAAQVVADSISAANEAAKERTKTMLKDIKRAFADFFVDLFENGLSSLRGFVDAFKTLFLRMIAEILAARVMAKLAGVLGASIGTASTAGAQGVTAAGGAAGLSTLALGGIGVGVVAVAAIAMSFLDAGKKAAEAAKRVREFNDAMGEFSNTTAGDLERAIEAVRKQAAQLRIQAAEMFLTALNIEIEAWLVALAQINLAEAQRILQLVKSAAALKLAAQQDLEVRLLRAKGLDAEADAMAFALEQQREYAQAVLDNADALYLATLAEVQRAEAIARSMAKVQGVIDGLSNTIAGLQGFSDALKLSPSLSPTDRLTEARRQYEAVLAAAQAGDQAAAGRLPAAAQAFLDASQAVNASGPGYAADYARVLADTEATIKLFEDAKSIQQQILDVLKEQLGIFKQGGIGDTIFGDGGGVGGGVGGGIGGHGQSAQVSERQHQEQLNELQATVRVLTAGLSGVIGKLDTVAAKVDDGTSATRRGFEALALVR